MAYENKNNQQNINKEVGTSSGILRPYRPSGQLDVKNMTVDELADQYEATPKNKKNAYEFDVSDRDENTQNDKNINQVQPQANTNEQSDDTNSTAMNENNTNNGEESTTNNNDGIGSKIKNIAQNAGEVVDGVKDKIDEHNPLAERKKWYSVMKKARQDDNWKKSNVPKWAAKALIASSSDPEAKKRLKDFSKKDKQIKSKALKGQARIAAGGSLNKAKETMEDIKEIREQMQDLSPKIQKDMTESMLEKIPQFQGLKRIGCFKLIPAELFSKVLGDNAASCLSCMPTSMKLIAGLLCIGGIVGMLVI